MNFSAQSMNGTIVSALDMINKPQMYNKLVGRYPKQRDLGWLDAMGKLIPVKGDEYNHHEEDILIPVQVIASVANGSGSDVIVTLDSSSHANSGKNSYPRIGNLVQFKNKATGLIIDKSEVSDNAHTITVRPVNASQNVQTAAIAGDSFIVYSSAFESGTSGFTKAVIPTVTKVTNQLQTFSEFFQIDSHAEEDETWITYTNPTTKQSESRYHIKGEADTVDRFLMQEELGLFITPQSDANLKDLNNNKILTTKALIPTLEESGNIIDYTTAPTMTTYDNLIKLWNSNFADEEHIMGEGLNFSLKNKNFHVDLAKNGAISYNTFGGGDNGSKRALELGFASVSYCGYTIHIKRMNILSHASTTGAPGFPYPDYFITIPMGKGRDPKTRELIDYFAIRYKKLGGKGNRDHWKVWETGGGSDAGTDSSLKRRVNYASVKGLQMFGAKRYTLGRLK